jgi:predicted RNA-binding protein with PUA-like domain
MRYWLFKSEPSIYGIDDLARDGTATWTGVRNYQARNFMRDEMRPGDCGFFYHSSCDEPGVVGILEVCRSAHPDETQFDRKSPQYDPSATRGNPRWYNVDVKLLKKTRLVGLDELRRDKTLKTLQILQRGNRLSITPVTAAEWKRIITLVKRET